MPGHLACGNPGLVPCTPRGVMKLPEASSVTLLAGARALGAGPFQHRWPADGRRFCWLPMPPGHDDGPLPHAQPRSGMPARRGAGGSCRQTGTGAWRELEDRAGGVVIDVGINRVDGRLVGDVAFAEASQVAGAITRSPAVVSVQ